MNKIVIDTNIFLSVLFSQKGASYQLFQKIVNQFEKGQKINAVSVPSIMELQEVFFREKNRKRYAYLSDDELNHFIDGVVLISHRVKLNYLWRPFLRDSKDDKILETAFNAGVKAIITYNIKDFERVYETFNIKILKPYEYLKEMP